MHCHLTTGMVLKKNREEKSQMIVQGFFNSFVACVIDVFHEERTIMSEINDIWYGFLEAGEKSSPILIDPKLDTGNSKTVYMYNLKSQKIIEYKREIAEPKLRPLSQQEGSLMNELMKGYDCARKEFTPRNRITAIPLAMAAGAAATAKSPASKSAPLPDSDELDEFDIDDADLELEDDLEEPVEADDDE